MRKLGATPIAVQFVLTATVWGASFLFIKVGLEGLSPVQVALGRLLCGAAALVTIAVVRRITLPPFGVVYAYLAVVAVTLCVVPFLLFAWAEKHVSSGLASIYNATTPLMTMAITLAALPEERPTRTRLIGLALGFAGVLTVLGPWRGVGHGALLAQLALLGATFCYGSSFVILRRFIAPRGLPGVTIATVQVSSAALILAVTAPWTATSSVHWSGRVVLAVVALGVLGTGLAYVWNTNVVLAWGATNASTVTYLTPVVGVLLGAVVLSETVTWNEPVGAVVVIVGIAVTQGRLSGLARRRPATKPELVPLERS